MGCMSIFLLAHSSHTCWQMLLKDSRSENWDSVRRVRNCTGHAADTHALQLLHEASLDQKQFMFFTYMSIYIYIYIYMCMYIQMMCELPPR